MTNPHITKDANPLNVGQPVAPPPTPSDITPPAPVDPALTPKPEQTARQDTLWNGAAMMGSLPGMAMGGIAPGAFYGSSPVMGGTADTAPFYNGFGAIALNAYGMPLGTWANYFLMERNPTVALAEATADAPIRAAEITYECREGTPAEVVDWVKGQFEHSERDLLDQFVYARGWGCRQAELVYKYDRRAGAIVFDKAKWLMPELTTALRDQHGNLVGLDNQGTQITDPRRFLWVTYDSKGCNPYGRSRKENCKKPWLREEGLYDILEYAMNIQVRPFGYVEYPYGLKDAAGNSINDQMKANAAAIASNLAQGKFGLVPNPFAPWMEEMITKGIDISKIMPYKIGWYDAKTDSGEGFERLLGLTNRGIVMGILQPPRSILEGPGTQADAGVHTDTGVMVNEIFLQNLCLAINKGPIDTVLVQRYGEEYRGCVYWKPAPMVDKQMSFNNELVKTVMGGPMGPYLQKRVIQLASIFEKSGVKINEFDQEQLAEDYEKEQADKRAIELDAAQAKGGKGDDKPGKGSNKESLSLSTAHKFACVHLDLPADITSMMSYISRAIEPDDFAEDGIENNPHVTVKYGIECDTPDMVRACLKSESPLVLTMGRLTYFPASEERPYEVLKLDVESDGLRRLHEKLRRDVPNQETWPVYQPHATIAYLKPGTAAKYLSMASPMGRTTTITQLVFSSRDGTETILPLGEAKPAILSTADTLLDDAVDSHHRLTPDERKRRKQFLLLLLGFFSWQAEALTAGTETADSASHTAKLTQVLAKGMQREAVAGLVADRVTVPHLNTVGNLVNTQAQHVAEQLNATTAKNIATAIANGKSLMEAIDQIATTAMETRASVIEEDMTYLASVIADRVELDIAQKESVWICADDDKVCSVCGPLHGLVAKAGEPFAPGIYYPVVNTHSRCRCRIEAVPDAPNL